MYFHVGNAVVFLEEVVEKVLNLTSLKWSICVDEHNGLLELLFHEIFLLCNHVKISNGQLVKVREAGRAAQGCKQPPFTGLLVLVEVINCHRKI